MDAVRGKLVALTICFSERDMLILHLIIKICVRSDGCKTL